MAQKINFSYTLIRVDDFGKEIAPHVWTGGVGHLVNLTIDVFATPLYITPMRWRVIDYTEFISSDYIRLFLRDNYIEKPLNWMVYWKPIHWEVYAVTVSVALLAALCLKTCFQLEFSRLESSERLNPSFSWILFEGWTILVSQGVTVKPKLVCGKICIIVTSIMALLVLQSYSSQLVSHLTVAKQLKVRTVDDVLENPNFKIGWFNLSIQEQEFNGSKNEQEQRIWYRVQKFRTGNIAADPTQVDKFLKEESTCFLTQAYDFDFNSRICNYFFVGKIIRADLYIGLQKGSKLTARFSELILKLRESGIMKRIYHLYKVRSKLHCHGTDDKISSVPAVSLKVAIGIFTPLAVAIPLSLIISLLENIHWNNCKRWKMK